MAAPTDVYGYPDYPDMRADFSLPSQYYERYTEDDHAVWRLLYDRQMKLMDKYACADYLDALHRLPMDGDKIPHFDDLNAHLYKASGWELVAVPGLLPQLPFFTHLATKAFPVTHWIRPRAKIDYLQEPDLFHDLFGHVPLLCIPDFANYMAAYGRGGARAFRMGNATYLEYLSRLYWYTVEFGLIQEKEGIKIYGAGILSSPGEVVFSIDSDSPNRIGFNMERIMQTDYIIDDYQRTYWVIDSIEQLFKETQQDFKPIYQGLSKSSTVYDPGEIIATDKVLHTGTGLYHLGKIA
jgi:phenylalanine-4-hydroxylase